MIYRLLPRDTDADLVGDSAFVPTGRSHPTEGVLTITGTGTPDADVIVRSRNYPDDPWNVQVVSIDATDLDASGVFDLPVKLSHEWQAEVDNWVDGEWNVTLRT